MDLSWGEKNETSTLNLILKVSMFSHYDLNLGLIKGDFPCDNSWFVFFFLLFLLSYIRKYLRCRAK